MSAATVTTWVCTDCETPMIPRNRPAAPLPPGHAYHQARGYCTVCYQAASRRTAAARAGVENRITSTIPKGCTILTGQCGCTHCTAAAKTAESPLALTRGRWVTGRGGIQIWKENL